MLSATGSAVNRLGNIEVFREFHVVWKVVTLPIPLISLKTGVIAFL